MEYGCIGEKLGHSFSKEIHALLADYEYELCEIEKDGIDKFMRQADFKAINVTIPYKETVIPYLYDISPEAKKIGAVNTVVNKNGRLFGYNTDYLGMKSLIEKSNISVKGKKVIILGSGGTSKTAYAVVSDMGASAIFKASRTKKEGTVTYDEALGITDADVIINTTPSGMFPNTDSEPIELSGFNRLSGVIDAVYNPLRTKLVLDARSRGISAFGGLYMLVAQAFYAYEYFVGEKKKSELIDEVYKKILSEKENIVLIGMPGSGKTTVGRIIAEKTGKRFIDTDDEITRREGKTPAELIKELGEDEFREKEKQAVSEAASMTGCVIATGGGVVTRKENTNALKRNGKIFFLDRDINKIKPTSSRPLSSDRESLKKRLDERYELYLGACDERIIPSEDAEENAKKIIKEALL